MYAAVIVFVSQFAMIFFRLVNVRAVAAEKVLLSVFLTGLIQLSWLIASALGIKGLLEGNFLVVTAYIFGGMLGSYISFKVKI